MAGNLPSGEAYIVPYEGEREGDPSRSEKGPAYGNLAELGLRVLAAFGGQVGPDAFSSPEAVVHLDRVYVPESQPDVLPVSVDPHLPDSTSLALMRNGGFGPVFRAGVRMP